MKGGGSFQQLEKELVHSFGRRNPENFSGSPTNFDNHSPPPNVQSPIEFPPLINSNSPDFTGWDEVVIEPNQIKFRSIDLEDLVEEVEPGSGATAQGPQNLSLAGQFRRTPAPPPSSRFSRPCSSLQERSQCSMFGGPSLLTQLTPGSPLLRHNSSHTSQQGSELPSFFAPPPPNFTLEAIEEPAPDVTTLRRSRRPRRCALSQEVYELNKSIEKVLTNNSFELHAGMDNAVLSPSEEGMDDENEPETSSQPLSDHQNGLEPRQRATAADFFTPPQSPSMSPSEGGLRAPPPLARQTSQSSLRPEPIPPEHPDQSQTRPGQGQEPSQAPAGDAPLLTQDDSQPNNIEIDGDDTPWLPSLDIVFKTYIPTLTYPPKAARND